MTVSRSRKRRRPPVWNEEKIIAAFKAFEQRNGRQPVWAEADPDLPSHTTVARWFGSWANACVAAGQTGWLPGGHSQAKDDETERLMRRVAAGETLVDVAAAAGCSSQALGRRIARYRRAMGLEPLVLRPGRRSPSAG